MSAGEKKDEGTDEITTLQDLSDAVHAAMRKNKIDTPVSVDMYSGELKIGSLTFQLKKAVPEEYKKAIRRTMWEEGLDFELFPIIDVFCGNYHDILEMDVWHDDTASGSALWDAIVQHLTDGELSAGDALGTDTEKARFEELLKPFRLVESAESLK